MTDDYWDKQIKATIKELRDPESRKEYSNLDKTVKKHMPFLIDDHVIRAVMAITICTCHSCHDASRGCQCWNDE